MNYGKTKIWLISALAIIITIVALFFVDKKYQTTTSDTPSSNENTTRPELTETRDNAAASPSTLNPAPSSLSLPVPFTSQAPLGNWVEPFKEACEEASSLMAGEYFSGNHENILKADYAKQEILKLVDWEQERFGYHLDIDTAETATVLEEYYGLQTKILDNFTADDLKNELAQGHLVLLPADGRKLGNPNFRTPGPPYHMLVIKGYDEERFLTNDPGTRKGFNYSYSFDILYEANGNWSHDSKAVDLNDKMVIVAWK